MAQNYLFTSESVAEGHPDKVADKISDSVLDAMLEQDRFSRVACETLVTTGLALVAGEITTKAVVDIPTLVRETINEIGYTDPKLGFSGDTCAVMVTLDKQSPDISRGVTAEESMFGEQGAGDQGLMFGYATDETDALMPMPIYFAHRITQGLARCRKDGTIPWLRPDGKSQVTVEYEDGEPKRVEAVVVAAQHSEDVGYDELKEAIVEEIVRKIIPEEMIHEGTKYFINATGRFVIGGPMGDCGLTGRKIIVDTYGGVGSHGGGCFSGKDPSKVDRSASYMCRYVAKNLVAAGLTRKVEVQLAYSIGVPEPVSVMVDTFGTGRLRDSELVEIVREVFPLKPAAMIQHLDLLRPIFKKTCCYGHFGRNEPEFTWEKTDMTEKLKEKAGV